MIGRTTTSKLPALAMTHVNDGQCPVAIEETHFE